MKLEFIVGVCIIGEYDGEILIEEDVSDEEYSLLKESYREGYDMSLFDGLEDLCDRIKAMASDAFKPILMDIESDEEIDPDDISYYIYLPEIIINEVNEEDSEGM